MTTKSFTSTVAACTKLMLIPILAIFTIIVSRANCLTKMTRSCKIVHITPSEFRFKIQLKAERFIKNYSYEIDSSISNTSKNKPSKKIGINKIDTSKSTFKTSQKSGFNKVHASPNFIYYKITLDTSNTLQFTKKSSNVPIPAQVVYQ